MRTLDELVQLSRTESGKLQLGLENMFGSEIVHLLTFTYDEEEDALSVNGMVEGHPFALVPYTLHTGDLDLYIDSTEDDYGIRIATPTPSGFIQALATFSDTMSIIKERKEHD